MTDAATRWRNELDAWAIPEEILAQAPESPWGCPPAFFRAGAPPGAAVGPSLATRRAVAALPARGTVLDVGCGGGAAAFALVPPAGRVIGVDESDGMLELFAATAADRGVVATTFRGRWPDVAAEVPEADVVVCHNVFYNVADLVPFATALTAHARHRVVAEITTAHPLVRLGPLWQRFWGVARPSGPTAELAAEVLREVGLAVKIEMAPATPRDTSEVDRAAVVAFTRRRLCLSADRDPDVDEALGEVPTSAEDRAVLWWDV